MVSVASLLNSPLLDFRSVPNCHNIQTPNLQLLSILSFKNPICITAPSNQEPQLEPDHHFQLSQFQPFPSMVKDGAVFAKGKIKGTVNFPPFDNFDQTSLQQAQKFSIWPANGCMQEYARHIPYNSEKKTFLEKTGRESFEVFQYIFKVPGDDKEYTVMWDYNIGLVRITPFFKCLKYSKTTPAKMLNLNPGLKEITHSITGGALAAQGYWMPWRCALAVCLTFCDTISGSLIPVFGPSFPSRCIPSTSTLYGRMIIDPNIIAASTTEAAQFRNHYCAQPATPFIAPFHNPCQDRDRPKLESISPRSQPMASPSLSNAPSSPDSSNGFPGAKRQRLRLKRATTNTYNYAQIPALPSNPSTPDSSPSYTSASSPSPYTSAYLHSPSTPASATYSSASCARPWPASPITFTSGPSKTYFSHESQQLQSPSVGMRTILPLPVNSRPPGQSGGANPWLSAIPRSILTLPLPQKSAASQVFQPTYGSRMDAWCLPNGGEKRRLIDVQTGSPLISDDSCSGDTFTLRSLGTSAAMEGRFDGMDTSADADSESSEKKAALLLMKLSVWDGHVDKKEVVDFVSLANGGTTETSIQGRKKRRAASC